jgi:hypothetical protein
MPLARRRQRWSFTVLAAPTPKTYARTDTSIWLLGLGNDPQRRIVRRVDDGGVTGKKDYRYEPETETPPTPVAGAMVSGEEMNLCGASDGSVSVAIRVQNPSGVFKSR